MDEAERRAQIRRHWEAADIGTEHEIYHDDAVLEFPQSGERFEGVPNFREWRSRYPAAVDLQLHRLRGTGDVWIGEGSVSYDGGARQRAIGILEFRGDKAARETLYVAEPWEAPEWRAQWRAAP